MKRAGNACSTSPIVAHAAVISRAATPPRDVVAEQIPMFGADGERVPIDVMYLAYGRHATQDCVSCFFFQRSRDAEGMPMLTCAKYPLAGIPEWLGTFEACGLYQRGAS